MQSRLSQRASTGEAPTLTFNVPNGNQNLVLADKTIYNKVEFEYALKVDTPDRIQTGRKTIIYDGVAVSIVSDQEERTVNDAQANVVFVPYEAGNDIGVTIQNGENVFDLKYKIVNKFKV